MKYQDCIYMYFYMDSSAIMTSSAQYTLTTKTLKSDINLGKLLAVQASNCYLATESLRKQSLKAA